MTNFLERIGDLLESLAFAHPKVVGALFCILVLACLVVNGLRLAYPVKDERPRWARFVIGFFDPIVGNLWTLLHKFGIGGEADDVPAASVRAAEPKP